MSLQQHLARIRSGADSLANGQVTVAGSAELRDHYESSWLRCFEEGLSPDAKAQVPVLEQSAVHRLQEEFGQQAFSFALIELNNLMNLVSEVGYGASLANSSGVIIAESVKPSQAYYCESDQIGSVWSEGVGGTNGIGTCIVEQRPVAVFRGDHFYYDLSSQACVAAPFYNPLGELQGVLNLTTCNPSVDINAHHIVYKLAARSSLKLEERLFCAHFEGMSILKMLGGYKSAGLIAVDPGGVICGATFGARQTLAIDASHLGRKRIWEIIDCPQSAISLDFFTSPTQARTIISNEPHEFLLLRSAAKVDGLDLRSRVVSKSAGRPGRDAGSSLAKCAGQDTLMSENVRLIRKVLNKNLPLLLLGETGAGKDTLAKAIHAESERSKSPFVAFNCAAVPESLIDSELFGYSKGAFTGANREGSQGRFVEADGGTLFLDEIGDMPLTLQTRLLRVLESGEVCPLGAGKPIQVNVQIIAATNQRLHEKVADGSFREDLFFRLAGMIIELPALRDREDKAQLIETILQGVCTDVPVPELKPSAWKKLLGYPWPGNVRELRHVLHRAVLFAEGGEVRASDIVLPFESRISSFRERVAAAPSVASCTVQDNDTTTDEPAHERHVPALVHVSGVDARHTLATVEGKAIEAALISHQNNIIRAADALGMSKATLYRKIKRYGIRH